jgi:hypothetical protein
MSRMSNEQLLGIINKKGYSLSDQIGAKRKDSNLERNLGNAPLEEIEVQEADTGKYIVRVTSYRCRAVDSDGLCEKYHVDMVKYLGFIPDDSPEITEIITTQKKVKKGDEKTVITIDRLPN